MHNSFIQYQIKEKIPLEKELVLRIQQTRKTEPFQYEYYMRQENHFLFLLEHGFFDPKNAILFFRKNAICKQYSHPYRNFREYCVDVLHFLT